MQKSGSAFKNFTGKPTGKSKRKWEDNIRMGRKETGVKTRNLIDPQQRRSY